MKKNDPIFMEKRRIASRKYYEKKKLEKLNLNNN
jgi:hypothetical protein